MSADNSVDKKEIDKNIKRNINISILEGSFGTVMGTFIGGIFLTGFALLMGADDFTIGLLAALPMLANLTQIAGSYIIKRIGSKKSICITAILLHRLVWGIIAAMPFVIFRGSLFDIRIWILVIFLGISSIFASLSGIAWLSWIADLIPREDRGRFFALRNMAAQAVGMILAVVGGRFIDIWRNRYTDNVIMESYGFSILFGIGVIFGIVSVIMLKRMEETKATEKDSESFINELKKPLVDSPFRKFIIFSLLWGFSVSIAGPFFGVYMIKNLQIPFSTITILGFSSGVSAIIGTRFWGRFIDSIGAKPIFLVCGTGGALIPLLWLFASSSQYSVVYVIHILTGFVWAGIGMASSAMMLNMAPAKSNASYFAMFAAITGLFGAIAPIAGGILGDIFQGRQIAAGPFVIYNLQLLFLLSAVLRTASLVFLKTVPLVERGSTHDLLVSIQNFREYLPIYSIQNHTMTGMNYMENMMTSVTRGIFGLERRLEYILTFGEDMGKKAVDGVKRVDRDIDTGLTRYEMFLERSIDVIRDKFKKLVEWAEKKKNIRK